MSQSSPVACLPGDVEGKQRPAPLTHSVSSSLLLMSASPPCGLWRALWTWSREAWAHSPVLPVTVGLNLGGSLTLLLAS